MGAKSVALIWFKTNLRLRDNECLIKALSENDEVIPFYCIDDALLQTTAFGFKKAGHFRLKFLQESLQQLDEDLRKAGSGLILLKGLPPAEISKLARESGANRVYAEKEVAPEELKTAARVINELFKLNCSLVECECRNLIHSADLQFSVSQLPEVFTDFRKRVEKTIKIRPVLAEPVSISSPPVGVLNLALLNCLNPELVETDSRAAIILKGGAQAAHQRLQYYFYGTQALSTYKETRNGMIGERYSSKFSAWLALGCISAREIYHEIKRYEALHAANESTYWLFFELLWRDYFGFCFEKDARRYFVHPDGRATMRAASPEFNTAIKNWINGDTGNRFIDANMIELKFTGFMSNRGRQNVASYFCNDLKLNWQYGAAYFEQQLVDYDVCNNWGNWAYLAGFGNDPRKNRYFNIRKQAAVYDSDGAFQELWLKT